MHHHLRLRVLTPNGVIEEDDVLSVVLPGLAGAVGVRHGHAPLLLALQPGPLVVRPTQGEPRQVAIAGGLAYVTSEGVSIVAPEAAPAEAISVDEAVEEVEKASERLEHSAGRIEHAHALAQFDRALARLRVTGEDRLWERALRRRRKFARYDFEHRRH